MPDINELLKDSEFQQLSPEDQQEIVLEFVTKNSKKPQVSMQDTSLGTTASEAYGKLPPWLQQTLHRGTAAGVGFATGGPLNAALMGAFPPETPGQWGASMLAGPVGKLAGKAVSSAANPAVKTLMSGLGGLGGYLGLNAATEGIDRATTSAGLTNIPKREVLPNTLTDAVRQSPEILLSTLAPMMGQQLIGNLTKSRPGAVSAQAVKDITGGADAINIPSLEKFRALEHKAPELAQVLASGQNPTPEQIVNTIQQAKVQEILDKLSGVKSKLKVKKAELNVDTLVNDVEKAKKELARKALIDKGKSTQAKLQPEIAEQSQLNVGDVQTDIDKASLELRKATRNRASRDFRNKLDEKVFETQKTRNNAKAELTRLKEEQKAYGLGAAEDAAEIGREKAGLDVKAKKINLEKKNKVDLRLAKIDATEDVLDKSLKKLQEDADSAAKALHPDLGNIAKATNPNELMQNISASSPGGVAAYRAHIARELGDKGVKAFQEGAVNQFFKEAYSPETKALSNAPKLFETKFTPDKLRAIFGNGPDAEEKVRIFTQAVDDIQSVDPGKGATAIGKMAQSFGTHIGWILPNMLVFHADRVMGPGLAGAAAVGGAAMMAVKYPKLIDAMLRNPKLGDSFHKWATGTTRVERSLSSWPRLAAWFKANAEPVDEVSEE